MLFSRPTALLKSLAALAVVIVVLSFETLPAAQVPATVWVADDVSDINLDASNCIRYPRVNGFDFGLDGTPMVGWTQVEGCSGSNETHWSEKLQDGWLKRTWDYGGFWGSGPNGAAHEFAVGVDGRPYLFMVGGDGGSLTYHTYRADLRAYADGEPGALVYTGEHVGNHQECIYVRYRVDGGRGQIWPYRVTARGQCNNSGPFRFEGQALTGDQLIRGFDLAVGEDGRAHIAYINVNGHVMYIRPGGAPVHVATVNYYSDDVAIQPGANGTVHIVARGLDFTTEHDRGLLAYFRSADDGATWTHVDNADASRVTSGLSLQLDASGEPAVAYWRYGQGLYYSSRASGAWVQSRVVNPGWSGVQWVKPPYLRFDAIGVPHIAYYDWSANRIRISSPSPAGVEPPVDLNIQGNASPNPTVAGTQVTYTLTIGNTAVREASGVRVQATLPAGATAASFNPAPLTNSGGVLTFNAWRIQGGGTGQDLLPAGATGTITFNVSGLITGISELPVVVTSTEDDADPADNSAVVTARINEATCALPVSGRTAWWPGDGTALNYGSGPAYHGTPVGGVSYGPGAVGQGFVLDGTTGFVKVPNGWPEYYWPGTGATSVAAWFSTEVFSATAAQVIASMDDMAHPSCCGNPQGYAAWYLYVQNGVVMASLRESVYGSSSVVLTGTTPVTDGQFHHAALVIDIPTLQAHLYVNGALEATAPLRAWWAMNWGDYHSEELVIGASQVLWGDGYQYFFNGVVDDVALYKRVLTPTEIANAASGPSRPECGAPSQAPTIEHPGDQQDDEGETISLPLTWTVGDGKIVAFMATGLPPGLTIDPHTGVISGTLTMESSGSHLVTVTISDGVQDTAVPFRWFVNDVNRDPIAVDDALTAERNTPTFTIPAAQLLANDSDPDGDDLFIIAVGGSTHGLAVLREDGNVDFTVNPVFHGTASFVYDVSDGRGGSAPANVVITVTLVNEDPIAVDDAAVTLGGPVTVNVLANDSDPDGDPLTITGITVAPTKGTATMEGASITYTPTAMVYDGADSFVYAIGDGLGGTASATVTITTPAEALADIQVTIIGVERDPESGIPLVMVHVKNNGPAVEPHVQFIASAELGIATVGGALIVSPTPDASCLSPSGDDQAHCIMSNLAPGAEVTIGVRATPLTTDSPRTFQLSAHAAGEVIDPDYTNNGMTAPVTIPLSISDLAVALEASRVSYHIAESVTFTARVTNHGPDVSVSSALALTIEGVGTASSPMCSASGAASGQQSWYCSVPSLAPGGTWTVTFDQVASVGGTRVSTAELDVAAMAIWMTDPVVANNAASVETTVVTNHAPVVVGPPGDITLLENGPGVVIDLTGVFSDADGDALVFGAVMSVPGVVALSLDASTGRLTLTPLPGAFGTTVVTVTASDGRENAQVQFAVHVLPVNDPPTIDAIDHRSVAAGGILEVQLSGLTAGPANEAGQTLQITAQSSAPLVTGPIVVAGNQLRISPPTRGDAVSVEVTVHVQDDGGTANGGVDRASTTFTLTVTVPSSSLSWITDQHHYEGASVFLLPSFTQADGSVGVAGFGASGLPPGVSIDPATGAMSGVLPQGSSGTYEVSVTLHLDGFDVTQSFQWHVTPPTSHESHVFVSVHHGIGVRTTMPGGPLASVNERITVADTVGDLPPRSIDVAVALQAPATVSPKSTFSVTATVSNWSDHWSATGTQLVVRTPPGALLTPLGGPGCTVSGSATTCEGLEGLAPWESRHVVLQFRAGTPPQGRPRALVIQADVSHADPDPVPSNNRAQVSVRIEGAPAVPQADIAVTAAVQGSSAVFTVTNGGPSPITNGYLAVTLTSTVPSGSMTHGHASWKPLAACVIVGTPTTTSIGRGRFAVSRRVTRYTCALSLSSGGAQSFAFHASTPAGRQSHVEAAGEVPANALSWNGVQVFDPNTQNNSASVSWTVRP